MYSLAFEPLIMAAGAITKIIIDRERENRKLKEQLANCGKPAAKALSKMEENDKKLFDSLKSELNTTVDKLKNLAAEYEALKAENEELAAERDTLKEDFVKLTTENIKLKAKARTAARKQKTAAELPKQPVQQPDAITTNQLLEAFQRLDTPEERRESRRLLNDLLSDNLTWKNARRAMEQRGFFRQTPPVAASPTQVYVQKGATAQFSEQDIINQQPTAPLSLPLPTTRKHPKKGGTTHER